MGNINNFDNVKPGTLALIENGIGGANAILVYLKGLQEVHGFTISAEGVIGCSRSVPHKCVISAFDVTCADGARIRDLLTELFTGSGTACQNLYKIYERSTKIVDMTIEEVSEIVSRQRGETVKVNIVEQCEESVDDEESADAEELVESICADLENNAKVDNDTETTEDTADRQTTHTYNTEETNGDMLEPAIGDIVVCDGIKTIVEGANGGCTDCFLSSRMCGGMLCTASFRKDGKSVKLRKVLDDYTDDNRTAGRREWELSEYSYDSIDPAVGDTVTVYGVRCRVAEGSGSCHKCVARTNGCALMDCTAGDRQDNKYVYLEKIEDGVVAERSDDGDSEWSIPTQDGGVVEPKLGTTGYVHGIKAVVAEVSELHGDNPCDHCVARNNSCCKIVCAGPDRGDKTGIYLRKAED